MFYVPPLLRHQSVNSEDCLGYLGLRIYVWHCILFYLTIHLMTLAPKSSLEIYKATFIAYEILINIKTWFSIGMSKIGKYEHYY